jgi:hypothetical protein
VRCCKVGLLGNEMIPKFYETCSSKAVWGEVGSFFSRTAGWRWCEPNLFPELGAKNLFLFIVPLVARSWGLFYNVHKRLVREIRYRQEHHLLKIFFWKQLLITPESLITIIETASDNLRKKKSPKVKKKKKFKKWTEKCRLRKYFHGNLFIFI